MSAGARDDDPLLLPLPEPTGRRMRLGPFPTVRDALKFVTVAAAGSVVAALVGPGAWLPFLGGGFALAVGRVDGKPADERVADYLTWRLRGAGPRGRSRRGLPMTAHGGVVRLPGGRVGAVLEAGGVPVAYRPQSDARRLFDAYRRWLRETDGPLVLSAGTAPIDPAVLLGPASDVTTAAEAVARAGYAEMLALLLHQRRQRRVLVLLATRDEPRAVDQLETRVQQAADGLAGLGIRVERLRDQTLFRGMQALGWSPSARAPA